MDSLTYQRTLAQYDEKITYHQLKKEEVEHGKARYVLEVLNATIEDRESKKEEKDAG